MIIRTKAQVLVFLVVIQLKLVILKDNVRKSDVYDLITKGYSEGNDLETTSTDTSSVNYEDFSDSTSDLKNLQIEKNRNVHIIDKKSPNTKENKDFTTIRDTSSVKSSDGSSLQTILPTTERGLESTLQMPVDTTEILKKSTIYTPKKEFESTSDITTEREGTTETSLFAKITTTEMYSTDNTETSSTFTTDQNKGNITSKIPVKTTTPMDLERCHVTNISLSQNRARKTSILSKWKIETSGLPVDWRCHFILNLTCIADKNENYDWVVPSKSLSLKVFDNNPLTVLKNLSEFTNYSCQCQLVKDEDDYPVVKTEFNIRTLSEVPTGLNFEIVNVTHNSTTLKVLRPKKIPGYLKKYHVNIKMMKPKHYVRKDCRPTKVDFSRSFSSELKEFIYPLDNLMPDYEYKVEIFVENVAGNSTPQSKTFLTNSSYSTKPLHITSKFIPISNHCNKTVYNSTFLIKWEMPCNTNGNFKEFEIETSTNNSIHKTSIKVPKNVDKENTSYMMYVNDIKPSALYYYTITPINEGDVRGQSSLKKSSKAPDGCPSEPINLKVRDVKSTQFIVSWNEPREYYGDILEYKVVINLTGNHFPDRIDPECPKIRTIFIYNITTVTNFVFEKAKPNSNYLVKIQARTNRGFGEYTSDVPVLTESSEPEPIRNLIITKDGNDLIWLNNYERNILLKFSKPCNINGQFGYYELLGNGYRFGYPNVSFGRLITNVEKTEIPITLTYPEYQYEIQVRIFAKGFSLVKKGTIVTDAGIPTFNRNKIQCSINEEIPTQIDIKLDKYTFGNENGDVIYYSILIARDVPKDFYDLKFGLWNNTWSSDIVNNFHTSNKNFKIYQMTQNYWNPFKGETDQTQISIGGMAECKLKECHILQENTNYTIIIRGFTKTTYRQGFIFVTTSSESSSNFGIIFAFVFVLLLLIALGISVHMMKRRNFWIRFRSMSDVTQIADMPRHVVTLKQFIPYYNKVTNDPMILKKQYDDIEDEIKVYKEENVQTTFATKPENMRKNRYTNILPYDEYRVKLKIDEDDEIGSDYINASYIRGYTDKVEYIATQGPLEHTCKDFWKMIIQEKVTVIVMVSQFIEKEKEKCFKYFPNNHGTMLIDDDIEVKCLSELQFSTYTVRTLLVRKDVNKYSLVHMQYLEWPDFGCPQGTSNMLNFCKEVRDRIKLEKGLMAVHCSAGVGRTGTIISLDILLQMIKKKKDISIFDCVMELRKQRTHMVQTEKQYIYIHTCIKDVLEMAHIYDDDLNDNKNYNCEIRPVSLKKDYQVKHDESMF